MTGTTPGLSLRVPIFCAKLFRLFFIGRVLDMDIEWMSAVRAMLLEIARTNPQKQHVQRGAPLMSPVLTQLLPPLHTTFLAPTYVQRS